MTALSLPEGLFYVLQDCVPAHWTQRWCFVMCDPWWAPRTAPHSARSSLPQQRTAILPPSRSSTALRANRREQELGPRCSDAGVGPPPWRPSPTATSTCRPDRCCPGPSLCRNNGASVRHRGRSCRSDSGSAETVAADDRLGNQADKEAKCSPCEAALSSTSHDVSAESTS